MPLQLTAGGPAPVAIAAFEATLAPPRRASGAVAAGTGGATAPETIHLRPIGEPAATRGQLCDAAHAVAQKFSALPAGLLLSSLDIHVRPGASPAGGTLSLHADDHGVPAAKPLPGGAFPLVLPATETGAAYWAGVRLAKQIVLPDGPWWLVCEIERGECLWFTASPVPAGADETRSRIQGASWIPAPACMPLAPNGPRGWAQTILRARPAAPA